MEKSAKNIFEIKQPTLKFVNDYLKEFSGSVDSFSFQMNGIYPYFEIQYSLQSHSEASTINVNQSLGHIIKNAENIKTTEFGAQQSSTFTEGNTGYVRFNLHVQDGLQSLIKNKKEIPNSKINDALQTLAKSLNALGLDESSTTSCLAITEKHYNSHNDELNKIKNTERSISPVNLEKIKKAIGAVIELDDVDMAKCLKDINHVYANNIKPLPVEPATPEIRKILSNLEMALGFSGFYEKSIDMITKVIGGFLNYNHSLEVGVAREKINTEAPSPIVSDVKETVNAKPNREVKIGFSDTDITALMSCDKKGPDSNTR